MADEIQYPDHFVTRLQSIWGEGFMSPGGPEEVCEIVQGLDVAGARVLDIGCGIGGPAIVLAGDLGAAEVVAVDVEAQLLEKAGAAAVRAGCAERITFERIEPGPLPFPAAGFDVVFSKDALVHVADKASLFAEVLRVLRPGGRFAASDWLAGEGYDPAYGARPLKRLLQTALVDPLALGLLEGRFRPGDTVTAAADSEGLVLFTGDQ